MNQLIYELKNCEGDSLIHVSIKTMLAAGKEDKLVKELKEIAEQSPDGIKSMLGEKIYKMLL